VLQPKYYTHCDILEVDPKDRSSFKLKNILADLPTFERGYIWRVGNGESINIYMTIIGFLQVPIGELFPQEEK
jgi:hypothetical protein